jgi:hypothetical protein
MQSVGGEIALKRLPTGRRKEVVKNPPDKKADDRPAQAKRPENNNHPRF